MTPKNGSLSKNTRVVHLLFKIWIQKRSDVIDDQDAEHVADMLDCGLHRPEVIAFLQW